MKKIFTFFLALIVGAGTLFAQSGNCGNNGNNVTWTLSNGVLTIDGAGDMADWSGGGSSVPSWYSYRENIQSVVIKVGVSSVGSCAFSLYENLTSVTLPSSITTIGNSAFLSCESLTSITLPDALMSIGHSAFQRTNLTSVTIPAGVESIGNQAFKECGQLTDINVESSSNYFSSKNGVLFNKNKTTLIQYPNGKTETAYTIPKNVTTIEANAFYSCSKLKLVTIPNSVTNINTYAFGHCGGLSTIVCKATTPPTLESNCFSSVDYEIPVLVPTESLAAYRANTKWQYFSNIQSMYCGSSLTWTLIDGVLTISGTGAMTNWSQSADVSWYPVRSDIKSVVIEEGVTSIGDLAFSGCSNMATITIPSSVTSIGTYAIACSGLQFISCAAQTPPTCDDECFNSVDKSIPVYVPDGKVAAYGAATGWSDFSAFKTGSVTAFGECGDDLTWLMRDNGTLTIEGTGFMWDFATETPFTYSISTAPWFGDGSENETILKVELPEGLTSIGNYAFYKCTKIAQIDVPQAMQIIGDYAFYGCKALATVTIQEFGATEIGKFAFFQCTALKSITLPSTLYTIGEYGFALCTGLTSITSEDDDPPVCGTACFANVDKSIPVYIPVGAKAAYKAANEWKDFTNFLCDESPSGTCGANLTWTIDCDGVLTISGTGAMDDNIPDWLAYDDAIQSVVIPEGVTHIGTSAFTYCTNLTSVTIPNSVTSVGNGAFLGCTGLTSPVYNAHVFAYLPTSYVGAYSIPEGIQSIAGNAFHYCNDVSAVTIPSSVTSIGAKAFSGCNLYMITSEAVNPPACGENCFYNVIKSIPVYVPAGTKAAYKNAAGWNEFTNIQEVGDPVVPTGIAYELVDLSTETISAGKYIIVFDDNKAHAEVGGSQKKDLIASSDELNIVGNTAYVPEGTACDVTIAPFGVGEYSILLAGDTVYLDLQAKNSVTTSKTASGFGITDGGDQTVQISKVLASDSKTYVLKHNGNYFRMYSGTTYTLPSLYRKKTDSPTGMDNIQDTDVQSTKVLRDGKIFILRDGKVYDLIGKEIK
jgi:hypothetical protein